MFDHAHTYMYKHYAHTVTCTCGTCNNHNYTDSQTYMQHIHAHAHSVYTHTHSHMHTCMGTLSQTYTWEQHDSHQCQLITHTHPSKCSVRSPAYDHEVTTAHTAAYERQLLKCCVILHAPTGDSFSHWALINEIYSHSNNINTLQLYDIIHKATSLGWDHIHVHVHTCWIRIC